MVRLTKAIKHKVVGLRASRFLIMDWIGVIFWALCNMIISVIRLPKELLQFYTPPPSKKLTEQL
jgi:hypothetical protein